MLWLWCFHKNILKLTEVNEPLQELRNLPNINRLLSKSVKLTKVWGLIWNCHIFPNVDQILLKLIQCPRSWEFMENNTIFRVKVNEALKKFSHPSTKAPTFLYLFGYLFKRFSNFPMLSRILSAKQFRKKLSKFPCSPKSLGTSFISEVRAFSRKVRRSF